MNEYQKIQLPDENWHVISMLHLRRGLLMASCSDSKMRVYVPGKAQSNNYLGQISEDYPVKCLEVFGSHLKKSKKHDGRGLEEL